MALLASKTFPATLGSQSSGISATASQTPYPSVRRAATAPMTNQSYPSPTESEFDDVDGPDSVKNWDEERVCEYLHSIKCGEYEKVFRRHHINGENLLEIDKEVLKEMGVEKVGDRVRLFLGIKKLRTKTYASQRRRNRVSFRDGCWSDCVATDAPATGIHRRSRFPLRPDPAILTPPGCWPCRPRQQALLAPV
jgi:mitogen-activated protein kinase kinase kinase